MRRYFALLVLVILASCSSNTAQISDTSVNNTSANAKTLVMSYRDFGPQVIAHEIIGNDWWQWQTHGDSRPREYNIKVVVFENINLSSVANQYPVAPESAEDYRYLEYSRAMEYLQQHISQDLVPVTTKQLQQTKRVLENHFDGE